VTASKFLTLTSCLAVTFICSAIPAFAQDNKPAPSSAPAPAQPQDKPSSTLPSRAIVDYVGPDHHFWDKENGWLFAGVGAMRTADYFSTLNMRRRGRDEILLTNDVVDNHAGFAFIEAGGTGVSILGSYIFHRYGHHRLERWTSIVHIGAAGTGAVRNYCLKTRHTIGVQP
jgi:hypothetical protein